MAKFYFNDLTGLIDLNGALIIKSFYACAGMFLLLLFINIFSDGKYPIPTHLKIKLVLPDNNEIRFLTSDDVDLELLDRVFKNEHEFEQFIQFLAFPMDDKERSQVFKDIFKSQVFLFCNKGNSQ